MESENATFSTSHLLQQADHALNSKKAPKPGKTSSAEDARETAETFEAFFLSQTLKSMFQGISTDGYFGGGEGEKVFRSMMLDEYGKVMARAGGVGVTKHVMDSILKCQEAMSNEQATEAA